eukprot:4791562-Prymnesium_polylepis.1
MRRAVMSVGISGGGGGGADGGGDEGDGGDAAAMLANISAQLENPRQLLMLLKLALAAGGAGCASLIWPPPSRLPPS